MNSNVFDPAPPSIPDHEFVRCVGAGSHGEVWLAMNVTQAVRAVRILFRRQFASDRSFAREYARIQRFEPISGTHPGLVGVLQVGQEPLADCFHYVMEVADDLEQGQTIDPVQYVPRTLQTLLHHGPLPVADCIDLALALTESVQHLHQHGLVHRGIKPVNVFFINELPKLADIALATGAGQKATGVGAQTLITPEGLDDPLADLFSLGKVIYQMITGLPPDRFPAMPDHVAVESDPTQLALLTAVIQKACEPELDRRFQSAGDLHEALLAVQQGVPLPPEQPTARFSPAGQRVVILLSPDAPHDVRLAGLLEERLRSVGYAVFLHDRSGFGVRWARHMEAEIRNADAVILLLSETSVRDAIFAYQTDLAIQAQRLVAGLVTVPVRVAFTRPLPPTLAVSLASKVPLHWAEAADDDELLADVLKRLGSDLNI
jgi:hypothetical protein